MYEIIINGVSYSFCFGMGFLRDANKMACVDVDGLKDVRKNIGLQLMIAGLMDGDPETLVNALDLANKGQNPRVTRVLLDSYIDSPDTDIDAVFRDVLDFLRRSNATKKALENLQNLVGEKTGEKS